MVEKMNTRYIHYDSSKCIYKTHAIRLRYATCTHKTHILHTKHAFCTETHIHMLFAHIHTHATCFSTHTCLRHIQRKYDILSDSRHYSATCTHKTHILHSTSLTASLRSAATCTHKAHIFYILKTCWLRFAQPRAPLSRY